MKQCVICHKQAKYDVQQWYTQFSLCNEHIMYTMRKPQFYEVKYHINNNLKK